MVRDVGSSGEIRDDGSIGLENERSLHLACPKRESGAAIGDWHFEHPGCSGPQAFSRTLSTAEQIATQLQPRDAQLGCSELTYTYMFTWEYIK